MKYIKLGVSDLNVSRICLGCMGFGDASNGQQSWTVDKQTTRKIIKYALDKGINFLIPLLLIKMELVNNTLAKLYAILLKGKMLLLLQNFFLAVKRN